MVVFWLVLLVTSFLCSAQEPAQRPFVIDICSYNNAGWYRKNLDSVFRQKYKNFRIIYTDDASSDDTADLVQEYVAQKGQENRFKLVRNDFRTRQLANHYRVIHSCRNDEIIIHLDGDDWFAHDRVLEKINEAYASDRVWMTYGNYKWWPSDKIDYPPRIPREVVLESDYREDRFRKGAFHPRSFYAWLGKRIKLRDLIFPKEPFKGKFVPAVADWALLYPMFEMAGKRFKCLRDVHYVYNYKNPINHAKMKTNPQTMSGKFLRGLEKYSQLIKPIYGNFNKGFVPIIYFEDYQQDGDADTGAVDSGAVDENNMCAVVKSYQKVKAKLLPYIDNKRYVYLAFSKPLDVDQLKLKKYARIIEQTREEAFYLGIDSKIFNYWPIEWLMDNIYFFQFKNIEENRQFNPSKTSGIFRVSHIYDVLGKLPDDCTIREFVELWQKREISEKSVGFFLK